MTKGIVVAGLSGGSGKSVVAVALVAVLTRKGLTVAPFKKGPDYIDAGWLKIAAGNPCYNLDPYLMSTESILHSFVTHTLNAERVVIEGNRGLYDGVNAEGGYSTAELAILLDLPVILVVDCTKTTRTVAAMVLGCKNLDPRLQLVGVVLNRLGSSRQERIIRQAVEQYTGIPVLGALPRMTQDVFPQRHLGVTPYQEHDEAMGVGEFLADIAEKHLDLAAIDGVMAETKRTPRSQGKGSTAPASFKKGDVTIGVLQDAAFQFYYPDNLEALENEGARVVEIDALSSSRLPELDALYIGGGFPEMSAGKLSANESFRSSVKAAAAAGLPIYAECGGLIYLGESIMLEDVCYPLAGVFPVQFGLGKKPQAHGYTVLEVAGDNPFYPKGLEIKGHEFRYSRVIDWNKDAVSQALTMKRGVGFVEGRDGLVYKNVLALYTHIHAAATPEWASGLVKKAREFKGLKYVVPGRKV
jgi:cobyrinic acid a,c-diamide synthase